MLEGCIRHQDPTTALNMISTPLFDVIAGLVIVNTYNPNICWDFISGKLCLFEKKIVRMMGQLVDWEEAEGMVVTGGKQALMYAVKNGMVRAGGEAGDCVVICSELAHYSIEHVCFYLGMRGGSCVRVKALASGEMDGQALEEAMRRVVGEGKKIAAVIAVGGATINLVPDDIFSVKQSIERVAVDCALSYMPYLHVDSVISWAWLAFSKAESHDWRKGAAPEVLAKIDAVLVKLSGIHYADSFGIDFHKTGFCPYAAGVFVARRGEDIVGMRIYDDMLFGENEVYRHTLENSRSGHAIVSIWIALRRMGLEGLRDFILYQLEVCRVFKERIQQSYSDHFEVINGHSLGWEIVLKPRFGDALSWDELQQASHKEQVVYVESCHSFLHALWYDPLEDESSEAPVIGFVKSYSRKGAYEKKFPAFLIHPTSLHYDDETVEEMLEKLVAVKCAFEERAASGEPMGGREYLHQFVPPR